jgi:very-short-patch-repair endonuclease
MVHDRERTAFLGSRGYRVLRYANFDAMSNFDGIADYILDQCKARRHPPPEPTSR